MGGGDVGGGGEGEGDTTSEWPGQSVDPVTEASIAPSKSFGEYHSPKRGGNDLIVEAPTGDAALEAAKDPRSL
jgi:hypothetical protein